MAKSKCEQRQCLYLWQDDIDEFPRCHFVRQAGWDLPPCELDDDPFEPEEDEDAIYDPDGDC